MKPAQDSDFNWVRAERECSVGYEFAKLEAAVKTSVQEIKNHPPKTETKTIFEFKWESQKRFYVAKHANIGGNGVVFERDGGKIVVQDFNGNPMFCITLALNDEGECRYRINGEGEYLRWQVVKKALSNLFLMGESSFPHPRNPKPST